MGIVNIFNGSKGRQATGKRSASTTRGRGGTKKGSGKYSQAQKTAYEAGRAYELGKNGGRVQLGSKRQEESFRAGVKSVKDKKTEEK